MVQRQIFSVYLLFSIYHLTNADILRRKRDENGTETLVTLSDTRRRRIVGSSSDTSSTSSNSALDIPSVSSVSSSSNAIHKIVKLQQRVCKPCPDDKLKYRDPGVKWICGAYQRARRSFMSECMMQRRNCQDGTMFTKIHDHRCKNDEKDIDPSLRHGKHFFYDFKVKLSGDLSKTEDSSVQSSESESETGDYSSFHFEFSKQVY